MSDDDMVVFEVYGFIEKHINVNIFKKITFFSNRKSLHLTLTLKDPFIF